MKNISLVLLVILFQLSSSFDLWAQDGPETRPVLGVRFTANYFSIPIPTGNYYGNYRVLSTIPSVFVEFGSHFDIHIGMIYAHNFNPHWVDYYFYEQDAFGLMLGFRLTSADLIKNLRIMGQVDGSATNVGYKITNSHYQEHELNEMLWSFSISLGADFQLNNKIHLFIGPGATITSGQGTFLSGIQLSPYAGIDYRF